MTTREFVAYLLGVLTPILILGHPTLIQKYGEYREERQRRRSEAASAVKNRNARSLFEKMVETVEAERSAT